MLGYDFACSGGPHEGLAILVSVDDPLNDCGFKFRHAGEGAWPDTLTGYLGEQPLDEVEPRTGFRCDVENKVGVGLEPTLHGGCLVGGVIVDNEV